MLSQSSGLALRFGAIVGLILGLSAPAGRAADKPPTGAITVNTEPAVDELKRRPVMVTILQDGAILQQEETHLGSTVSFSRLPVGTSEVRVEGEGLVTLVKRGIAVRPEMNTAVIGGPMQAGTGVRIIEYASGGLTREELATRLTQIGERLAKIEAAVTRSLKSEEK